MCIFLFFYVGLLLALHILYLLAGGGDVPRAGEDLHQPDGRPRHTMCSHRRPAPGSKRAWQAATGAFNCTTHFMMPPLLSALNSHVLRLARVKQTQKKSTSLPRQARDTYKEKIRTNVSFTFRFVSVCSAWGRATIGRSTWATAATTVAPRARPTDFLSRTRTVSC